MITFRIPSCTVVKFISKPPLELKFKFIKKPNILNVELDRAYTQLDRKMLTKKNPAKGKNLIKCHRII